VIVVATSVRRGKPVAEGTRQEVITASTYRTALKVVVSVTITVGTISIVTKGNACAARRARLARRERFAAVKRALILSATRITAEAVVGSAVWGKNAGTACVGVEAGLGILPTLALAAAQYAKRRKRA